MAEGSGNDVVVKFGASIDELKDKIGEVQGLFKELTERFAVLAAVVGGGEAFRHFIDVANEANESAAKMSRMLGITAEEAGSISTAIKSVGAELGVAGVSTDTYTGAFLKFNRQLRTNSQGLKDLGIDVDAVKNGTMSSNEVFQQALSKVGEYKVGIDQTQIAMKLFGRSVGDVQVLMRVSAEAIEKARIKNEELNLTITQEGIEGARKYRDAMHEVGEVLEGMEKTIGEAVMPLFAKSAEQLASFGPMIVEATKAAIDVFVDIVGTVRDVIGEVLSAAMDVIHSFGDLLRSVFGQEGDGPTAMEVFKNALALVKAAFILFRTEVQEVILVVRVVLQDLGNAMVTTGAVIGTTLSGLGDVFKAFAKLVKAALSFDVAGASAAWDELKTATSTGIGKVGAVIKDGLDNRARIIAEGNAKALEIAKKGAADVEAALMSPLTGKAKGTPAGAQGEGGDKSADIGKTKKSKDTAAREAAARQALLKAEQESEIAYAKEANKELQKDLDDRYKDGLIATADYFEKKKALQLADIDQEIAAKQKEFDGTVKLEDGAGTEEQRLKFAAQEEVLNRQINLLMSKRGETIAENSRLQAEALTKLQDDKMQFESTEQKDSGEAQVAREQAQLAQVKALRQISAQDATAIEQQLENDRYSIDMRALEDKRALIKGSELEQQKAREALQVEEEKAERDHQTKLTAISNQAELEREKYSLQASQSTQTAFSTMVNGFLSGTQRISDVFRNFAVSIANTFTNLISQKFTEQLFDAAGVNKAISQAVGFVTDGIASIVKKFALGQTAQTAAESTGAAERNALRTMEAAYSETTEGTKTALAVAAQSTITGATIAGATTRVATEEAAGAQSMLITAGTAIANIAAKAWEAAASVYASIATIPYVGPFLAPAMAIAAGAAVLGFGARIASSEGGEMQVDQDRLNFVHKDETILPARYAEGLRGLIASGNTMPTAMPPSLGQASGQSSSATPDDKQIQRAQQSVGGKSGDVHFSVSAIDTAGVKKFFDDNGRALAMSLQNQGRNFVGLKAT